MSWRRELAKLRSRFGRQQEGDDLNEEIQTHLQLEELENRSAGMSVDEARYAARRRFGNVALAAEKSREIWGWEWAETFIQDLRFGIRQLRHNPGFTTVAILTLALGIGATTAMFSVVNSVLLRPLPYRNPEQLVQLMETEASPGEFPLSPPDYLDWQLQNRTLEASSLYTFLRNVNASGAGQPEPAAVVNTQANFFQLLGVQPLLGRPFSRGEDTDGKNRVAVLSYSFWQQHLGGAAAAVGKTVVLNKVSYTVVGVMPRWFFWRWPTDIWTPLAMDSKALGPRGTHGWLAVGRLKKNRLIAQAQGELLAISKRLEKQYPDSNNAVHAIVMPLRETLVGSSRVSLLILMSAVLVVLLIACMNVANLQMARASVRHRELAIRNSLGAGRFRLVRQLLTESMLLAFVGAALGTLGAWGFVRLLDAAKTIPIPRQNAIEVDASVLLFTSGLSVLVGVLAGLLPALQSSDFSLSEELKAGSQAVLSVVKHRQRVRDVLVVAEISLTLALLVGAGLLLRSFAHLRSTHIGINPERVLTMALDLPPSNYATAQLRRQFYDELLARVDRIPGIGSAALSTEIPLEGGSNGTILVDDMPSSLQGRLVGWNYVTDRYFSALGIPVVEGRRFGSEDFDRTAVAAQRMLAMYQASEGRRFKAPDDLRFVAVISRNMAKTFWPGVDPVGRIFRRNDVKVEVIGVVGDVSEYGIRAKETPQAYYPLPLALAEGGFVHLTVKSRIPIAAMMTALRTAMRSLDSELALFHPKTMDQVIAQDTQDASVQTLLLGTFALLALLLAAVGLYGVMSYLVTQRTREIGIRMALGARRSTVLFLIVRRGTRLTFAGLVLGSLAALALTRWMSSLLYGITTTDPLTFSCVGLLLAIVSMAAYYVPARRATRVDPMLTLRYE